MQEFWRTECKNIEYIILISAIFSFIMWIVYYCTDMNSIKKHEHISDMALTI